MVKAYGVMLPFNTILRNNEEKWKNFKDGVNDMLYVVFDKAMKQHRGYEHREVTNARQRLDLH